MHAHEENIFILFSFAFQASLFLSILVFSKKKSITKSNNLFLIFILIILFFILHFNLPSYLGLDLILDLNLLPPHVDLDPQHHLVVVT